MTNSPSLLPPPVPAHVGTAASVVNPFMVPATTDIIPDDYAGLPPVIAKVLRDTDRMAERMEDTCNLEEVKGDAAKVSSLGRTFLHLQRVKLAALETLVKTSESAAAQQLMRAQTAHVEQQTSLVAGGMTDEVRKALADIIARRVPASACPIEIPGRTE